MFIIKFFIHEIETTIKYKVLIAIALSLSSSSLRGLSISELASRFNRSSEVRMIFDAELVDGGYT